ncbi:MAG TPA: winged helix-turn-helix domain-containing protein [Candidatus Thermoplasmatota archaeon]|jgi:predicted transcriptional regulator|nr:winged helix-turn-helix domain-containing protein [Candidatus Thermoplasmatota archaeon]
MVALGPVGRIRRVARRSPLEIWMSILSATVAENGDRNTVRTSRVQAAANLPHDRFWEHVQHLEHRGLLRKEPFEVTPRGREFLREMQQLAATLERFGIPLSVTTGFDGAPVWGEPAAARLRSPVAAAPL